MMNDILGKGKAEKQDETGRFAQFKTFCEMTSDEKTTAIADGKELVEKLKSEIQQADADIAELAKGIAALNDDSTAWKAEVDAATKEREQQNKDFQATEKDYYESIDGVDAATKEREQQNKDF